MCRPGRWHCVLPEIEERVLERALRRGELRHREPGLDQAAEGAGRGIVVLEPDQHGTAVGHEHVGAHAECRRDLPGVGVQPLGGGTGEQIGVPAQRDTTQAPVMITLNPGQSARARLQITRAENYGGVCNLKPADGFRVYPPGATDALFLPYTANGCGNPKIILLHVGAFQPLS